MVSTHDTARTRSGQPVRSPALKRAIDITGSGLGLVVAAVPMAVVAAAVRRSMGSPVLFRQERPGRDGKLFTLVKFRTMKDDQGADADRVTRLGLFLRSTSLDELPELWNVLKGDMSLVGPRPLLLAYLDRYSPRQARRHEVRPGLTGLAQINGRNLTSWENRFEMDVEYVDTWTIGGDLKIMARTLLAVVRRSGVSADDHATMPEFLGTHVDGAHR